MSRPLYLFVGPSGCGKTTVTGLLESRYGYQAIASYTTRQPRYDGEQGHEFISKEDFDALGNLVAYTVYNGFRYGVTEDQVDNADLYVLDIPGVETLLENYKNTERAIRIFYLDSTVRTRIDRMTDRHDSDSVIIGRLYNDEAFNWCDQLNELIGNCKYRNVKLYKINANENIENVLQQVLYHIKKNESE